VRTDTRRQDLAAYGAQVKMLLSRLVAELTMGQWVMGQMGQQIWAGHMGHGSVPVTR